MRKIALQALDAFSYPDNTNAEGMTSQRSALIGFFEGISNGNISVGQDWPIQLLLEDNNIQSKEDFKLLEQIFASGMVSFGQQLSGRKKQSFAGKLNN